MSQSIVLSRFARKRLFPAKGRTDKLQGTDAEQFVAHINAVEPVARLDGYAPFCKLWVYENWTPTRVMAVPISDANRHLLRSAYEARTSRELPVLTRWFEGVDPPRANYLIVILYSREQMALEGDVIDAEWGVVGCLPTAEPEEIPMAPITMLRNALGVEEGGSGVPLDREAYQRSVAFWDTHANWREYAGSG